MADRVACPNCGDRSASRLERLADGGYISMTRSGTIRHMCAGPDRPWEDADSIDRDHAFAALPAAHGMANIRVIRGPFEGFHGTVRRASDDRLLVEIEQSGQTTEELLLPQDVAGIG